MCFLNSNLYLKIIFPEQTVNMNR